MKQNIREKHHRLPRACYQGLVTVSITACIEKRVMAFQDSEVVNAFLIKLKEATERNNCSVLIYCFMPDHMHAILQGRSEAADSWRAMFDFKQQTGFWFARHCPEISWQKDFYDHIIRTGEDLGAQIRYFANNPVRWNLVKDWAEYPYTGSIGSDLKVIMADAATL